MYINIFTTSIKKGDRFSKFSHRIQILKQFPAPGISFFGLKKGFEGGEKPTS